jgi:hypothetical protein
MFEDARTRPLVWGAWRHDRRLPTGDGTEDFLPAVVRLGQASGAYPQGMRSFADDMGWYGVGARRLPQPHDRRQEILRPVAGRQAPIVAPRPPDHMGWYGARLVTLDFLNQRAMLDAAAVMRFLFGGTSLSVVPPVNRTETRPSAPVTVKGIRSLPNWCSSTLRGCDRSPMTWAGMARAS